MARATPAATGRSLRTSSPRAPTMQHTLSLYSPLRLLAISVYWPGLRFSSRYRLGSPSAMAWISPLSTATPSRSAGYWRQVTSLSGSMPFLASRMEKKFLPGAARSGTPMVLPFRLCSVVAPVALAPISRTQPPCELPISLTSKPASSGLSQRWIMPTAASALPVASDSSNWSVLPV